MKCACHNGKKRLNKIGLGKLSYAVVALDRLKKRPADKVDGNAA